MVLNKCSKCIAQFFLQYMRLKQSGVHCQCVQRCNLIVTALTPVPLTPACRITTVQWKHFNSCCQEKDCTLCAEMELGAESAAQSQVKCHHCCLLFTSWSAQSRCLFTCSKWTRVRSNPILVMLSRVMVIGRGEAGQEWSSS